MWNRISGKKNEVTDKSTSQTPRRKDEDDSLRHPGSIKASDSKRNAQSKTSDSERAFNPTTTAYSSTSRIAYPNTAGASVASSHATASANGNDGSYTAPVLNRNRSLAEKMPKSSTSSRTRRDQDEDRDSRSKSGIRSNVGGDDEEQDKKSRRSKTERKSSLKTSGSSRSLDDTGEATNKTPADFSQRLGSSGFQQLPGQPARSSADTTGSSKPPEHEIFSSRIQDQFPGQFPSESAEPYRPPLAASEGGPGLAVEYYGDAGQSVAEQPGYRQNSPSLIIGQEPHLLPASSVAAPPPEPSVSGRVGAAASFFSGEFEADETMSSHAQQTSSVHTSRPSGPTMTTTSSGFPGLASAAMGATAGYTMGNHFSAQEQDTISNVGTATEYMTASGQRPPSQSQASYYSSDSRPPESTSWRPSTASGRPSHADNIPIYPAAAAGAAGLAGSAMHSSHHSNVNAFSNQQYAIPTKPRHRHRGPFGVLVDFVKDPEGVAQYEEYSEYVGICRGCFEPGTSPRDAPRRHRTFNRKRSDERIGRVSRVEKSRRDGSNDERRRTNSPSWLAAGLAGYGLGRVGEALFKQTKNFDDTYSVRSGRYSPEGGRKYRDGRASDTDVRPRRRLSDQYGNGIVRDGKINKQDTSGFGASASARSTRIRSRSRSKDRKGSVARASLGEIASASSISSATRRRNGSEDRVATEFKHVYKEGPSSDRRQKSHKKKKKGFFSFGSDSSSSSLDLALPKGKRKSKGDNDDKKAEAALLGLSAAAAALAAADRGSNHKRNGIKELVGRKETLDDRHERPLPDDAAWEDEEDYMLEVASVDSGLAFGNDSDVSDGRKHDKRRRSERSGKGSLPRRRSSWDNETPAMTGAIGAGMVGSEIVSGKQHEPSSIHEGPSPPLQYVDPMPVSDFEHLDETMAGSEPFPSRPPLVSRPSDDTPFHQPQPRAPVASSVYTTQAPYSQTHPATADPTMRRAPFHDVREGPDPTPNFRMHRRDTSPARMGPDDIASEMTYRHKPSAKDDSSVVSGVRFALSEKDEDERRKRRRRIGESREGEPLIRGHREQDGEAVRGDEPRSKQGLDRDSRLNDGPADSSSKSWAVPVALGLSGAAVGASAMAASRKDLKEEETKEERRERRRRERRRDEDEDEARRERRRREKKDDMYDTPNKKECNKDGAPEESREERKARRRREREERERKEGATPPQSSHVSFGDLPKPSDRSNEEGGSSERQVSPSKKEAYKHEDYSSFFAPIIDANDDRQVKISGANADVDISGVNSDADISLDQSPNFAVAEARGLRFLSSTDDLVPADNRDGVDPSTVKLPWPVPRLRLLKPTPNSTPGSTPIIAPRDAVDNNITEPSERETSGVTAPEPRQPKDAAENNITESSVGETSGVTAPGVAHVNDLNKEEVSASEPRQPKDAVENNITESSVGETSGVTAPGVAHLDDLSKDDVSASEPRQVVDRFRDPPSDDDLKRLERRKPKKVPLSIDQGDAPTEPVSYGDDKNFAALLAASAEDAGFDPSIIIDNPTYRRRDSPPGSDCRHIPGSFEDEENESGSKKSKRKDKTSRRQNAREARNDDAVVKDIVDQVEKTDSREQEGLEANGKDLDTFKTKKTKKSKKGSKRSLASAEALETQDPVEANMDDGSRLSYEEPTEDTQSMKTSIESSKDGGNRTKSKNLKAENKALREAASAAAVASVVEAGKESASSGKKKGSVWDRVLGKSTKGLSETGKTRSVEEEKPAELLRQDSDDGIKSREAATEYAQNNDERSREDNVEDDPKPEFELSRGTSPSAGLRSRPVADVRDPEQSQEQVSESFLGERPEPPPPPDKSDKLEEPPGNLAAELSLDSGFRNAPENSRRRPSKILVADFPHSPRIASSPTAIPIHFRYPTHVRARSSSPSPLSSLKNAHDVPQPGRPRPRSTHSEKSREYRPLWLVEWNQPRQDLPCNGTYPSRPSSHSTSRNSSPHAPNREQSSDMTEKRTLDPLEHNQGLLIDTGSRTMQSDLLDSQQATPTAASFQRSSVTREQPSPPGSRWNSPTRTSDAYDKYGPSTPKNATLVTDTGSKTTFALQREGEQDESQGQNLVGESKHPREEIDEVATYAKKTELTTLDYQKDSAPPTRENDKAKEPKKQAPEDLAEEDTPSLDITEVAEDFSESKLPANPVKEVPANKITDMTISTGQDLELIDVSSKPSLVHDDALEEWLTPSGSKKSKKNKKGRKGLFDVEEPLVEEANSREVTRDGKTAPARGVPFADPFKEPSREHTKETQVSPTATPLPDDDDIDLLDEPLRPGANDSEKNLAGKSSSQAEEITVPRTRSEADAKAAFDAPSKKKNKKAKNVKQRSFEEDLVDPGPLVLAAIDDIKPTGREEPLQGKAAASAIVPSENTQGSEYGLEGSSTKKKGKKGKKGKPSTGEKILVNDLKTEESGKVPTPEEDALLQTEEMQQNSVEGKELMEKTVVPLSINTAQVPELSQFDQGSDDELRSFSNIKKRKKKDKKRATETFLNEPQEPESEQPVSGKPLLEQQKLEQPVSSEQPMSEQSTSEQPTSEQPTSEQPTSEQPTSEQPVSEKPTTEQPKTEQPMLTQPDFEQPVSEKPTIEQPKTEQPILTQPDFEQPVSEKPTIEQPKTEQPMLTQPDFEQPVSEKPTIEQPKTEQPILTQPDFEQPVSEKPTIEQPKTEQPLLTQPDFEQPVSEKRTLGQPKTEQPISPEQLLLERPVLSEQPLLEQQNLEQPTSSKQPTLERPNLEQPVSEKSTLEQPETEQPVSSQQPLLEQQEFEQPVLSKQTTLEQPNLEQPISEKPRLKQPKTEQLIVKQPKSEQPVSSEQPILEQPVSSEQLILEHPKFEQPVSSEQPILKQPKFEQLILEQPKFEQLILKQPMFEQPVSSEQPILKQPISSEQLILEQPKFKQPVSSEQPILEQPVSSEQLILEHPKFEQPVSSEQPILEQPKFEQPMLEQSVSENPMLEQSKSEQTAPATQADRPTLFEQEPSRDAAVKPPSIQEDSYGRSPNKRTSKKSKKSEEDASPRATTSTAQNVQNILNEAHKDVDHGPPTAEPTIIDRALHEDPPIDRNGLTERFKQDDASTAFTERNSGDVGLGAIAAVTGTAIAVQNVLRENADSQTLPDDREPDARTEGNDQPMVKLAGDNDVDPAHAKEDVPQKSGKSESVSFGMPGESESTLQRDLLEVEPLEDRTVEAEAVEELPTKKTKKAKKGKNLERDEAFTSTKPLTTELAETHEPGPKIEEKALEAGEDDFAGLFTKSSKKDKKGKKKKTLSRFASHGVVEETLNETRTNEVEGLTESRTIDVKPEILEANEATTSLPGITESTMIDIPEDDLDGISSQKSKKDKKKKKKKDLSGAANGVQTPELVDGSNLAQVTSLSKDSELPDSPAVQAEASVTLPEIIEPSAIVRPAIVVEQVEERRSEELLEEAVPQPKGKKDKKKSKKAKTFTSFDDMNKAPNDEDLTNAMEAGDDDRLVDPLASKLIDSAISGGKVAYKEKAHGKKQANEEEVGKVKGKKDKKKSSKAKDFSWGAYETKDPDEESLAGPRELQNGNMQPPSTDQTSATEARKEDVEREGGDIERDQPIQEDGDGGTNQDKSNEAEEEPALKRKSSKKGEAFSMDDNKPVKPGTADVVETPRLERIESPFHVEAYAIETPGSEPKEPSFSGTVLASTPIITPVRGPLDVPEQLTFADIIEPSAVIEPPLQHARDNLPQTASEGPTIQEVEAVVSGEGLATASEGPTTQEVEAVVPGEYLVTASEGPITQEVEAIVHEEDLVTSSEGPITHGVEAVVTGKDLEPTNKGMKEQKPKSNSFDPAPEGEESFIVEQSRSSAHGVELEDNVLLIEEHQAHASTDPEYEPMEITTSHNAQKSAENVQINANEPEIFERRPSDSVETRTREHTFQPDTPLSAGSMDMLDPEEQREYNEEYRKQLEKELSPLRGQDDLFDTQEQPSYNDGYREELKRQLSAADGAGEVANLVVADGRDKSSPSDVPNVVEQPISSPLKAALHHTVLSDIMEEKEPRSRSGSLQDPPAEADEGLRKKRSKRDKKSKKSRQPVIWEDGTATAALADDTEPTMSHKESSQPIDLEEPVEEEKIVRRDLPSPTKGSPSVSRSPKFDDGAEDYFGVKPRARAEEDVGIIAEPLPRRPTPPEQNQALPDWSSHSKRHPLATHAVEATALEQERPERERSPSHERRPRRSSPSPERAPWELSVTRDERSINGEKLNTFDKSAAMAAIGPEVVGAAELSRTESKKGKKRKGGKKVNKLKDRAELDNEDVKLGQEEALPEVSDRTEPMEKMAGFPRRFETTPPLTPNDSNNLPHSLDESQQREDPKQRDSAIQITDSPVVPTAEAVHRPQHDSGYPATDLSPAVDEYDKDGQDEREIIDPYTDPRVRGTGFYQDPRERPKSVSSDPRQSVAGSDDQDLSSDRRRSRRRRKRRGSNVTYNSDDSNDSGYDKQRRRRQALMAEEAREPSPVSSTTKDRSSVLFDSSPSNRQVLEQTKHVSPYLPDNNDVHNEQHRLEHPDSQTREIFVAQSHDFEPYPGPQEAKDSRQSIFGGPINDEEALSESRSLASGDARGRQVLRTISEDDMENSPLARKGKVDSSDVGSPSSGVKARRTSRDLTPLVTAAVAGAAITGTEDLVRHLHRTFPDEEDRSPDMERSSSWGHDRPRRTSNQSNISAPNRDSEWRRQAIGSPDSIHAIIRTPDQVRSSSGQSLRSSGTPPLRRVDRSASGDLRAASLKSDANRRAKMAEADPAFNLEPAIAFPPSSSSKYEPLDDKDNSKDGMADVYEGDGWRGDSPMSPTRPPSMRKRQSMQFADLEQKFEQLAAEHRSLQNAKSAADRRLDEQARDHSQQRKTYEEAMQEHKSYLAEKDAELSRLHEILDGFKRQVSELTSVNEELQTSRGLDPDRVGDQSFQILAGQHDTTKRELQDLREQHARLAKDHEDILEREIEAVRQEKDYELQQLQEELERAKEQVRDLQQQILASRSNDDYIEHDEDYFETRCTALCQHVQQWVLRFSKFSDNRACRLVGELNDDMLADLFDDAILDGTEVDDYLQDRIKRRDVFMSVVMSRIFDFVFRRYLFGLDREHRKKLKDLDATLTEVGPQSSVHKWRSTTLTLLSSRPEFADQREEDTEGVVDSIFQTLAAILPPKKDLIPQITDSLRRVVAMAVDLHIEMRLQRAEFQMLPPLKPQFDPVTGDLTRKVPFNATMMNERSGDTQSNEQLQEDGAVVRMVLFPLVVKNSDDEEQIVVCPAQVLVAKEEEKKKGNGKQVRVISAQGARSEVSFAGTEDTRMTGEGGMF